MESSNDITSPPPILNMVDYDPKKRRIKDPDDEKSNNNLPQYTCEATQSSQFLLSPINMGRSISLKESPSKETDPEQESSLSETAPGSDPEKQCASSIRHRSPFQNLDDQSSQIHSEYDYMQYFDEDNENSPIEVVRATVSTVDDQTLPVLTFRFWVLGTSSIILGSSLTTYNWYRSNSLEYNVSFTLLVTYLLGKLMARYLPTRVFTLYTRRPFNLNWSFTMNPGPFNIKEHVSIGIAALVGGTNAYGISLISMQSLYSSQDIGFFGGLMFLFSSQSIGYGIAGFLHNFLITPSQMVWPSTFVHTALFNSLHQQKPNFSNRLSRLQFFMLIFCILFVYQWLPRYIAPILGSLAFLCWINPRSKTLYVLGSGLNGLGMFDISLDWAYINNANPMFTPWWSQVCFLGGVIITLWLIVPLLYFTNTWNAQSYNVLETTVFDSNDEPYNITRVLDSNYQLNVTAIDGYSQVHVPPYFALRNGMSFIAVSSTIPYVFLFHGHELWVQFKDQWQRYWSSNRHGTKYETSNSNIPLRHGQNPCLRRDIHVKLMSVYPQVPHIWYTGLFLICSLTGIVVITFYIKDLSIWGFFLSILLACVFVLPVSLIKAVSNYQVPTKVAMQFIAGYLFPNQLTSNMIFQVYGYMTTFQCQGLLQNMKLGQYMKIPPRKLFIVQVYSTLLSCTMNLVVCRKILLENNAVLYESLGQDSYGKQNTWSAFKVEGFFSGSLIYGIIGPDGVYGKQSLYKPLLWCWAIGFVLPFVTYFLHRRFQNSNIPILSKIPYHLINISVIASGASFVPATSANFLISGLIVSAITQWWLYRYRHEWWLKYNYILSAAMDAGTQASGMALWFFTNGASGGINFPRWIGNEDNMEQCGI